MNELAIIAALKASRTEKLKAIDESEARLIDAVKASHALMRSGVGVGADSDQAVLDEPEALAAAPTDVAEAAFPPVKAGESVAASISTTIE